MNDSIGQGKEPHAAVSITKSAQTGRLGWTATSESGIEQGEIENVLDSAKRLAEGADQIARNLES